MPEFRQIERMVLIEDEIPDDSNEVVIEEVHIKESVPEEHPPEGDPFGSEEEADSTAEEADESDTSTDKGISKSLSLNVVLYSYVIINQNVILKCL